jgi:NAD(P)-dependent dehydrogenase (short-subunit alcohol dehydrogenase family)
MNNNFRDKVIVITGASGGVGRATAHEFAKHGAKIALLARGLEGLEGAKREVEQLGGKALIIPTDVSDPVQVEAAAEKAETQLGPIDVWVNNAMNSVFAMFKEVKPEEFRRVTEVTYLGQVYGTMSALKRMQSRNSGSIILVGSALAYRGIPLQSAYCGAKHGIQGFYDSLRCELMHDKSAVRMCMVQLPAMNTTQFGWVLSRLPNEPRPMGKIYTPEVAARGIVYAAAHDLKELLIGFPTYEAIVGDKVASWYADSVLARTGIKGQQTNEPKSPDRKNDLWAPVGEDRGTHGPFGDKAHDFSLTLWLSMHGINPMILFWGLVALLLILLIILV